MKKKKLLRNASLVALSAVMTCGVALGATACGGSDDPGTLRVSIFCNAADAATNQAICDAWAEEYGKQIGREITVQLEPNTSKDEYFKALGNIWTTPDQVADVIYLAPRYVKAYVEKGRIVDLSEYIAQLDSAAGTTKNVDNLNRLWDNSLNYYGYAKGKQATYTMGQSIKYNASGANGAGFYTVNGNEKVGLYALPKDYSNFSTGYNRIFFTPELKEAYTTTKATAERNVGGPTGEGKGELTSKLTYTANTGKGSALNEHSSSCIVYATDVTNFKDKYGNVHNANAGDPANIINVGIPTTYYPFNFFRFASFQDALLGGDPMATLCNTYTNGKGYTVTIPGFPDETFKIPDGTAKDPNAPYDTSIGHITYTYAEYSALLWAMTYYLNTFNWNNSADGKGGYEITTGENKGSYTIYAGEQYEGAAGSPLYLLPWLASNDADLIDITSRYCTQSKLDTDTVSENVADLNVATPEAWRDVAGKNFDTVSKQTLSGTPIERNIQYGYNSENFIETYGAFLALSSDWNGNPMGDTEATRTSNGWSYFRSGRAIFYGAGSWDAATRNDVSWDVLQCGQMPTPIAEKYALYSNIKGANYEMVEYSNDPTDVESATSYGDRQRTNKAEGLTPYDADDIIKNQVKRQDKWAARMDSVGYAVTNKDRSGDNEWKTRGAVSLALALTAQDDAQITLTYGGAQLPNFKDQCEDFFNYQDKADGVFKDMITPEGFSTTEYYNADGTVNAAGKAEADAIWEYYYGVAKEMATKSLAGDQQTVGQFLAGKTDYDGSGTIRYDKQYENTKLSEFVGENTNISFAMKVLRMVTYYRSDRDLNIRMQYGLNAVRDSSMYTYDQDWMGKLDARDVSQILAYRRQVPITPPAGKTLKDIVRTNPAASATTYYTPAVYCFTISKAAHDELLEAIKNEATAMR